jgi:hypothetical protein
MERYSGFVSSETEGWRKFSLFKEPLDVNYGFLLFLAGCLALLAQNYR